MLRRYLDSPCPFDTFLAFQNLKVFKCSKAKAERLYCIFYSLFGIPLNGITVINVAGYMTILIRLVLPKSVETLTKPIELSQPDSITKAAKRSGLKKGHLAKILTGLLFLLFYTLVFIVVPSLLFQWRCDRLLSSTKGKLI